MKAKQQLIEKQTNWQQASSEDFNCRRSHSHSFKLLQWYSEYLTPSSLKDVYPDISHKQGEMSVLRVFLGAPTHRDWTKVWGFYLF